MSHSLFLSCVETYSSSAYFLFSHPSYNKAVDAKKERESKSSASFGAKGARHGAPKGVSKTKLQNCLAEDRQVIQLSKYFVVYIACDLLLVLKFNNFGAQRNRSFAGFSLPKQTSVFMIKFMNFLNRTRLCIYPS